jgi:hypothetical protein
LLLAGCIFGDDSKSGAPRYGDAGATNVDTCANAACMRVTFAGGAGAKAVPEPFSMELAGVVSQPVRWANFDVTVMGARVARGLSDKRASGYDDALRAAGLRVGLDPSKVYVELDLKLENKGADEVDYTDRGTWDVVLAGGQRLTSVDALGVSVLPGDQATTSVHYQVDDAVDLHGAVLVLNGGDRQTYEPEQIPIDRAYVQQFPRHIPTVVGQVVAYHVDTSKALVHVDEAAYDANDAREGRAKRDKRVVWLTLAFASMGENGGFYSADNLRIVVNGRASAPMRWDYAILNNEGITKVLPASFEIDKTATHFEIMIPDGTAEGQRFPVDVADTVLATDIP